MEHSLEFKNIEQLDDFISADMYINGDYIIRLSDKVENIILSKKTEIKFLTYFYHAMKHYIEQCDNKVVNSDIANSLFSRASHSLH
jgi:hypothetical protein